MAAPYELWAFGFSVIGIADSIPAGVMNIFLFWVLCVVSSGLSPVQRSPTECGVSGCDRETSVMRRPWPTRWLAHWWGEGRKAVLA